MDYGQGYLKDNGDTIELNLWGGSQIYIKRSKKYILVRDCGLFSNITVSMFAIFLLTINGYDVDDIELTMTDYFHNYNIYPLLFFKKDIKLSFEDISDEEIKFFVRNCHPTMCGLGLKDWGQIASTPQNFNLSITKKIIDRFYTPTDDVYDLYNKMLKEKDIINNDYIFIWARKTDKIEETQVPSAQKYYELLKEKNLLSSKIFIQTDDKTVFNDFSSLGLTFDHFKSIPFAKGYSFHRSISTTPDDIFYEDYSITKEEYVKQMICVVLLAVNAKLSFIYPGNPTTVVPMFKNTFDGCILFKDGINTFK